jgi:hypothetical protein
MWRSVAVAVRRVQFGLVWMSLIIFVMNVGGQAARGAEEATVAKVLEAWRRHQASTKSFQCDCSLEQSVMKGNLISSRDPWADPLRKGAPQGATLLRSDVTFSLSGDKIAYSKEGDQYDPESQSLKRTKIRKVFDGICDKNLYEGASVPMGEVVTGGRSSSIIMLDNELLPFLLPFSTVLYLERLGYEPTRMVVSQLHTFRDGQDCVELSIPTSASFTLYIYADCARDYMPIEYVKKRNGLAAFTSSVMYASDRDGPWRISAMQSTLFDRTGAPSISWSYKVKRSSINEPLNNTVFVLEFPESTHVVEGPHILSPSDKSDGKDRKHYVVARNKKPEPISADRFGRSGSDAVGNRSMGRSVTGIALLFVLLTVLVVIFAWRWRRKK